MANTTVPEPTTPSPMVYGLRRYCNGVYVDGKIVAFDFNDMAVYGAEIRVIDPSDGTLFFYKDMHSGAGKALINTDLGCGDIPTNITIRTGDVRELVLLRTVIEWLYRDEKTPARRRILRMFYARVLKALSPDGHSGHAAMLSTGAAYFCKCSVSERGFATEDEALAAYSAHVEAVAALHVTA